MKDVIIVGGGIAGLTLGFYLKRAGADVLILEKEDVPGGVVRSEWIHGHLVEHGPNSALSNDEMLQLVSDLQIAHEVLRPASFAKARFLTVADSGWPGGFRLEPAPTGLIQAIRTPILSLRGKLRILAEPFIKRGALDDESVYQFARRRFGKESAELLFGAMLSGVWAADIRKLSARSALEPLWDLEQASGSVIVGGVSRAFSGNSKSRTKKKRELVTFPWGLSYLTAKLEEAIGKRALTTSAVVTSIRETSSGWSVWYERTGLPDRLQVEGRIVVLATPATETARLIRGLADELCKKIESIPYAPLGVMHVSFDLKHVTSDMNGFGFLVAPAHGKSILGAIFCSSLFPDRAPIGRCLVTCFVGGASNPEAADITHPLTSKRALTELKDFLGATEEPALLKNTYWPEAIPNYPVQHYRTESEIAEFEQSYPGLHIIGNWRKGISVSDRVKEAEHLARKLTSV
jgi:protoporphyrinogen/coproporphyrinogen III oxidase